MSETMVLVAIVALMLLGIAVFSGFSLPQGIAQFAGTIFWPYGLSVDDWSLKLGAASTQIGWSFPVLLISGLALYVLIRRR